MQIDKSQILDLLRSRGQGDAADRADRELPGTVDTQRDRGLLESLGLTPQELVSALAGGGGLAGIAHRVAGSVGNGEGRGSGEDKGPLGGLGGLLGK